MKRLFGLLLVTFLGGLWLSLKGAECRILTTTIPRSNMPYCNNTSSGKTCFMTLLVDSRTARKPFEEASHWCKTYVPGSSLIVINSLEIQRAFQGFIWRQVLEYEAIIMDAQMLSTNESQKWSWVNGQPYSPDVAKDISTRAEEFHDGACVESKSKNSKSVNYCFGNVTSLFRYICELSDSKSNNSYSQGNKSYVASEGVATWFDARKECLRLNGELASITNLRTIIYWSSLLENQKYWIGLHRNKWIWNSTGAALTYTNWKNGFPEESSDKQCICFYPKCGREKEKTTICEADYDRKWWTCNCNHNHTIVCQKEEMILSSTSTDFKSSAETTTKLRLSSSSPSFLSSASTTTKAATSPTMRTRTTRRTSSQTSTARTYSTTRTIITLSTKATTNTTPPGTTPTTTSFKPVIRTVTMYATTIANHTSKEIATKIAPTSSVTQEPPSHFSEHETTAFESLEQFNSSNTKEILLILLLFVAVVFIIVAVFMIIRKRKYDRRNEGSSIKNTTQSEAVSSVYATVVPVNRPSEVTVPPCNTIYAEVEMIKQPTPPASNTIYASIQPTSGAIDMGKSVVYADLDYPKKNQEKPRSCDEITSYLSPIYSQPCKLPTSASGKVHAEPIKPDKRPTATAPVMNHNAAVDQQNVYSLAEAIPLGDLNAIYSEPNKPRKSSTPTGKAVKAADPIDLDAIDVKHGAGSVDFPSDPSAVYAEPIKLKKTP